MKFTVTLMLSMMVLSSSMAQNARTISVAGLIVSAGSLHPIENATIYDGEGHVLGTSDAKGYYRVNINYALPGDIKFVLRITKDGYSTFTENEHWGDLPDSRDIINFGLTEKGSRKKAFAKLGSDTGTHDLGYENVLKNFNMQKASKAFRNSWR